MAKPGISSQHLPAVTSPSEKQGYLGDLDEKSTTELQALLMRQESLLQHQKHLLQKLPDKGAKVQKLIDDLKTLLGKREAQMDHASELFETMAITANKSGRDRLTAGANENGNDPLKEIVNVHSRDKKVIVDERDGQSSDDKDVHVNAYDKVMSRVTERQTGNSNEKKLGTFVPSKSTHTKTVGELTQSVVQDIKTKEGLKPTTESDRGISQAKGSPGKTLQEQPPILDQNAKGKLRYRYDESLESSMYGPTCKHHQAKTIDVQEAISLQQGQKQAIERLQIQQATEKLAQRFSTNMKHYHPEGDCISSYRVPQQDFEEEDDDKDDEEDEPDYPD